jgi:raffinose/stachyose/melibiose transport system permease protein
MSTSTAIPAPPEAVIHPVRRRRGAFHRRRTLINYLLIAPALLLSIGVVLVPGIMTAVASLTDWDGLGFSANFIGTANFDTIFADPTFMTSLVNNIKWVALFLTIPVAIGLLTAWLLLTRKRSRTLYQVIYLMPYVLAPVVNAMVWLSIMYNPNGGVVGWLNEHGIQAPAPLSNMDISLYSVAAVDMWHFWGFLTVVYLGAMRQTPMDQVEAAMVEGASAWQIFRHVYLPNIRSTLLLMGVMIVIFSFLAFDYVYLLTQGGPAHSSEVLGTYAYAFAFSSFQFGKAAAVGLVMSFFGLVASVIYTWLSRRDFSK